MGLSPLLLLLPTPLPSWVGSGQKPRHCPGPQILSCGTGPPGGGDAFLSVGCMWGPGGVTLECRPH